MDFNLIKRFKNKLEDNTFGIFSKTTDSSIIEILGHSGLDFVILDIEHGFNSYGTLKNHIRAAELTGMVPIIRVSENNEESIGKALDIGAYGVQVPNINSKEQVEQVIKAAKFYPIGDRGVCKYVRAAEFTNIEKKDFFQVANDTLIIIQVEGKEGVRNIDDILNVKGIDILFIGPYDLSQSLGVPGEIMHDKVLKAMNVIINKAKLNDVKIGVFCDDMETAMMWKKEGVNYISYSVDYGIIINECKNLIKKFTNLS